MPLARLTRLLRLALFALPFLAADALPARSRCRAARGEPEMDTFQVLSSDWADATDAVRRAVGTWRFTPAERGGQPVRQVVQTSVDFACAGAPGRGEVVVWSGDCAAPARP